MNIFQFMNDKVNAMRDYQRAIKLDPKYALAYFNAANIYFQNHQFSQVVKLSLSKLFNILDVQDLFIGRA